MLSMWRVILLRRTSGSHARARRGVATAAAPRTFRVRPLLTCPTVQNLTSRLFEVESSGPREVQVQVEGSQTKKVFPSLQEVVEAADDGDIIELAPGRCDNVTVS